MKGNIRRLTLLVIIAVMTMFMMAMHVGNGIGPIALGGMADLLGLESAFYTAAACMAAGIILFAWMVRSSTADMAPMHEP